MSLQLQILRRFLENRERFFNIRDIEGWLEREPQENEITERKIRTALQHLVTSGFLEREAEEHNRYLYQISKDIYRLGQDPDIRDELHMVIGLLNRFHGFMRESADREDPVLTQRLDAREMMHLRVFDRVLKLGTNSLPGLNDAALSHIRNMVWPVNDQGAVCFVSVTYHAGLPGQMAVGETISRYHLRQLLLRDGQLWAYGLDHTGEEPEVRWFSTDLILDVRITTFIPEARRSLHSDYFDELPTSRFHFLPGDRAVTVSFTYRDPDERAFLDSVLPRLTKISRQDGGGGLLVTFPARENTSLRRWLRQWGESISDLNIRPDK